ncbi:MAG: T9SS type A sorting domain-containing protein, partial [Flavobacteriales bacterium]|nr:T9SS type A sorting domain-containing protein [Flavobacteriales bacterium]
NNNLLTAVDLSQNTSLWRVFCHTNQLTSLDLSQNTAMTSLSCQSNQLTLLNVANGTNTSISTFYAYLNSGLTCIQVDDVSYSTTNWIDIDAASSFSANCGGACLVTIPDANFKSNLVGNTAINTNGDTEIQCSEASGFTGSLNCASQSISDLTGIEAFTSLTTLLCHGNLITTLDVSSNLALEVLSCGGNLITSLQVNNNAALTFLGCWGNSLTNIDLSQTPNLLSLAVEDNALTSLDLSLNPLLTSLSCGQNSISTLDVSGNAALTVLKCNNNSISSLDLSVNTAITVLWNHNNLLSTLDVSLLTALTDLSCHVNDLTSLDVANNTALIKLYCYDNQLTALDVTGNTLLEDLGASDNQLTTFDVSQNTALTKMFCYSNQLTSLNVANGNNSNFTYFSAITNPNLACIQVDDVAYSTTNWTDIDAASSFSLNCSGGVGVTELSANEISIYPNPASAHITINTEDKIASITVLDLTGKVVKNPTLNTNSIDVSNLPTGVYFLQVLTQKGTVTKKFIKQ